MRTLLFGFTILVVIVWLYPYVDRLSTHVEHKVRGWFGA